MFTTKQKSLNAKRAILQTMLGEVEARLETADAETRDWANDVREFLNTKRES